MFERFFNGEIAVYAATAEEADRFLKAYIATGVEPAFTVDEYPPLRSDIEFTYDFYDNQLGWADHAYDDSNQGWHSRHLFSRKGLPGISNPGAPYTSVTVEEFFSKEEEV